MAMTYTPVANPNNPPVFGQSGASVLQLQQMLNQQNQGVAGYVPLKLDGLYGPLTQQAANMNPTGPGIVSSGQVLGEVNQYSKDLDNLMRQYNPAYVNPANTNLTQTGQNGATTNPTQTTTATTQVDPNIKFLDMLSARSDDATKMLIATVNANRANRGEELTKSYDNYTRGLRTLGVEDGFASTPDIVQGQVMEAENQKLTKLRELDTEQTKAIADANQARLEKDYRVFKEKMDYVNDLKKQKLDAIKNLAADQRAEEDQYMQRANFFSDDFYSKIAGLSGAQKAAAIKAASAQTGIPEQYIVASLASTAASKSKSSSGGGSSTAAKKTVIQNINNRLNSRTPNAQGYSVRGKDNYVDPQEYIALYEQWPYGDKEWIAAFPAEKYINPASLGIIPTNLKAKSSSTGRSA